MAGIDPEDFYRVISITAIDHCIFSVIFQGLLVSLVPKTSAAGEKEIKIHGALHKVEAEVVKLDNMSAHADSQEVLEWIGAIPSAPKRIFVTHGEPAAAESLKARINKELQFDATVPRLMDSFDL